MVAANQAARKGPFTFSGYEGGMYVAIAEAAAAAGRFDLAMKAAGMARNDPSPQERDATTVVHEDQAYAAIAKAAAGAGKFDDAMVAAANIFNFTYQHQQYAAIAQAAAAAGRLDDAMEAARKAKPPELQSLAYAAIAWAAGARQPRVAADALVAAERATKSAAEKRDEETAKLLKEHPSDWGFWDRAYTAIAWAAAAAGRLDDAMVAAGKVNDASTRAQAYAAIAEAAAAAGRLDDALKAARQVEDARSRSRAYAAIAQAAGAGSPNVAADALKIALKAAGQVEDARSRSQVYTAIAQAAGAGSPNVAADALVAAMSAVERYTPDGFLGQQFVAQNQADAYAAIAEVAAGAGQLRVLGAALDAAMKAAEATGGGFENRFYATIAWAAGRAGRLNDALVAAGKATRPDLEALAYAAIAEAAAGVGDITAAEKALERISSEQELPHSRALAAVAVGLARERRFYEARVRSSTCRPPDQLRVYAAILSSRFALLKGGD